MLDYKMTKFYNNRKPGMKRAKSGKFYYPAKGKQVRGRRKYQKKMKVYRDPFPKITRRRLSYAFRTTVTPGNTSAGGFSIAKQTFLLNSCLDPDKTVLSTNPITGTSSRQNHQPMGFDQLAALYQKYMVTYARLNVKFAFQNPTAFYNTSEVGSGLVAGQIADNTPCRVGIVTSDADDLPTSLLTTGGNLPTFEKLIEQAKSGCLQPKNAQFKYRTLMKDGHVSLRVGCNPFKFTKVKDGKTWSDYKEDNLLPVSTEPGAAAKSNPIYAHCFVSPLSTISGENHSPVTVYGTIDFDVMFSDLINIPQS